MAEYLKQFCSLVDALCMAEQRSGNEAGSTTTTLGAVLRAQREQQDVPISRVATLCGVMVDDVEAVENDDHDLSPLELDRLMQHYRDPSGGSRQTLGELSLDLTGGVVSYSDRVPDKEIANPVDRVLAQYVQMLYNQRQLPAGTPLPIKDLDLTVLRLALSVRQTEVVKRIETIQRSRLLDVSSIHGPSLAVGGLVAAGAVALAVFLAGSGSQIDQPTEPAAVSANPDGAAVIGEAPDALASTNDVATNETVIPVEEITVEIGEAVTIVRPPS